MGTLERLELQKALEAFFDGKRAEFLEGYGLLNEPALLWQCAPANPVTIDLASKDVSDALIAGGGPAAEDGWWEAFRTYRRPGLTFDGISATQGANESGWETELHVDGYIAAAVWKFPDARTQSGERGVGIGDFYSNAFHHFCFMASNVYKAAGVSGEVHVTCTMHQANRLPLLSGYNEVSVQAPKRATLRWPISAVDATAMADVATKMAAQFMRIYGRNPAKR